MGRVQKVTPNFTVQELRCPCCHLFNMENETLRKLQNLRDDYKLLMAVNSACRCPEHNDKVGGGKTSQHITTEQHAGRAFDIKMEAGVNRYRFIQLAMHHGFNGIGVYANFVHIDDRKTDPVLWHG